MSLIDKTYFINEILLPEGKYKPIEDIISRYEPRIIYDLFGYELGTLIEAYDAQASDQRIKDIVEGKEYEVTNDARGYYSPDGGPFTIKWNGLVNDDKVSLIAYWCYYWWCRENDLGKPTVIAGAKAKLRNADNVGFNEKSTFAWNQMFKLYGYEGQPEIIPSAYNFMEEHKDTYPEWIMKRLTPINQFGI